MFSIKADRSRPSPEIRFTALPDNHADKVPAELRNGDDTVEGHLRWNTASSVSLRARRHVNKQIIEIAPVNLIEEFGSKIPVTDRAAPRNRHVVLGSKQIGEMILHASAPMPGFMPSDRRKAGPRTKGLRIDGPVTSASMMPTFLPARISSEASKHVTDVLPTPPLPLTTPITF